MTACLLKQLLSQQQAFLSFSLTTNLKAMLSPQLQGPTLALVCYHVLHLELLPASTLLRQFILCKFTSEVDLCYLLSYRISHTMPQSCFLLCPSRLRMIRVQSLPTRADLSSLYFPPLTTLNLRQSASCTPALPSM